jgi:hypothetical protein
MKLTKNRKLILQALAESNKYENPPYSASSVRYTLETAFEYKWQGYDMKTLPSLIQIHRTLKDLWYSGLVVGTRVKADWYDNALPCWIVLYQLSCDVEKNYIISECEAIYGQVGKAKFGTTMFDGVFDMGLPADKVKPLADKVRAMMQRTHPDKAGGYENEFRLMRECHEWIKNGIPLPVPTHTKGDKIKVEMTYLAGKK